MIRRSDIQTEVCIPAIRRMDCALATVSFSGQMVRVTRECGKQTKSVEMETLQLLRALAGSELFLIRRFSIQNMQLLGKDLMEMFQFLQPRTRQVCSMSMAKQDNYKKERTETALSFHFSDFGMRGYISMVKPSGLFLRFSFSFW